MKAAFFIMITLASCGRQGALAADDWWMKLPYESNEFNYKAEYGQNVNIECNDTLLPDGYLMQYWIRPDLKVMFPGMSEYFRTLDGDAGWYVNSSTGDMNIVLLQESQFGFYYCVLSVNNSIDDIYVVKKALNYEEAYFGNLWTKYEMNTIIGLSSAGGFFIICVVLMLICKYHVRADYDGVEEDDGSSVKGSVDVTVEENSTGIKSLPERESSSRDKYDNLESIAGYENTGLDISDEKVLNFFQASLKPELTTDL